MTVEVREDQENANDSIRLNNDPDSIEIDESDLQRLKQDEPRTSTLRGITMDGREEPENAEDSIRRNNESDSIETGESDPQQEKQKEPRISTVRGMQTQSLRPKYRMKIERSKLCKKKFSTTKCSLPSSIEIEISSQSENTEPSRISTVRGMTMDVREELENAEDSIRRNNESDSIETDESDSQLLKQKEPRISTVRGMTMDVIEVLEIA
jgi:hypothetical protein